MVLRFTPNRRSGVLALLTPASELAASASATSASASAVASAASASSSSGSAIAAAASETAAAVSAAAALAAASSAKAPCRVASTANIALLSGLLVVDGVTTVAGDRVLVKNQTTGAENGIYVVAAGAWTRATDFDGAGEAVTGMIVFVNSGTINSLSQFVITTTGTITIGVTSITFALFEGPGITLTGPLVNVGGYSRNQLDTAFNLDNTGRTVYAWNYSAGGGEVDVFINRSSGTVGGFSLWDFPNTSGDPTRLFFVQGSNGVTWMGANGPITFIDTYMGGQLRVTTDCSATGSGNCFVAGVTQNSSPNTTNYPTAVTGYGVQDVASTGNTVYSMFGRADLYATGVATAEFNTFNYAAAPSATLPPDRSIGTTQYHPITLTVAAGGDYDSSIGIHIDQEGSEPQSFLTGIYMGPAGVATYGLFIDAATAVGSRGPTTGAVIRNYGAGGANLVLQTTGGETASNLVLSIINSAGSGKFGVTQDGTANGLAYQVGGTQVVGARNTGFAAMTGTPDEGTTYDTASVTLPQLAGRVAAIQAALTTHGLIGA
jgi:hypothetical protein